MLVTERETHMGLDWVIQPIPDDEQLDKHDYYWRFRGKRVSNTSLPDSVTRHAYTDMTPWEMDEFGEKLLDEIERNPDSYTTEEKQTITEAAEWLQYWASEDKSLYASW